MPEIKNTFSQGKMNKDLDERLVPNGSYRNALNVDVTTSEGANAGTVQNILGNSAVEELFGNLQGFTCVASIPNEKNNKLYWFVKGLDREAIVEYNSTTSESRFIAVDLSMSDSTLEPFLKFSDKYITGISILDDLLFWTDGVNEPKKINIKESSQENPALNINQQTHAVLKVDGEIKGPLKEEHITVVKKKPSNAPTVEVKKLSYSSQEPIFEKIFPRFCFRYKYKDGEYSAFGPFTDVVFNPVYQGFIDQNTSYMTDEPYNKAMSNTISAICLYDFVPSDIPSDVVQVDLLYKQENSTTIYSIANIKYTDDEWSADGSNQFTEVEGVVSSNKGKYTVTSEGIHAALPSSQLLRPWDNVPKAAVAQEIIGNRLVYGNYIQGYDFEDNLPRLNSSFELRNNQNFNHGGLRSIKSQRDYQLGVVVGDEYGRETPVFTSADGGVRVQWADGELGKNASNSLMFSSSLQGNLPDWANYYKFYVKETSTEYYNMIMDKAYIPPKHVDFENRDNHVWISFASSDRNKLMEDDFIIAKKVYSVLDPSQVPYENKFQVLDIKNNAPDAVRYIFTNLGTVSNTDSANIQPSFAGDTDSLFPTPENRIDKEVDVINLRKSIWLAMGGAPLVTEEAGAVNNLGDATTTADEDVKDIFISWEKTNPSGEDSNFSNRYKVSSVRISNGNVYVLKLSKKINQQDSSLVELGVLEEIGNLSEHLNFRIERRDSRNSEDFSGKFFVKIKSDDTFTSSQSQGLTSLESQPAFWMYDTHTTTYSELDGIVNDESSTLTPPELTAELPSAFGNNVISGLNGIGVTTEGEWELLLDNLNLVMGDSDFGVSDSIAGSGGAFFIDNMQFVASNPSSTGYAKESGEGWDGSKTMYDKFAWTALPTPGGGDSNVYGWGTDVGYNSVSLDSLTNTSGQGNFAHFTTSLGGHGLAPRIQDFDQENLVNGIDGVVTSQDSHVNGSKRWLSHSIYNRNAVDDVYSDVGKYYIHLSFLAPGVDLHNGVFTWDHINVWGQKSIAKQMQGIWGGGIFTKTPTGPNSTEGGFTELEGWTNSADMQPPPETTIGGDFSIKQVEFEGNYNSTGEHGVGLQGTPSPGQQISQGMGYDPTKEEEQLHQWDPSYRGNSTFNQDIANFVNQIQSGSQFRFAADGTGEVYTIQNVERVNLYNHTPWRMKWVWNGTQHVAGGYSVEEAASNWADLWSDSDTTSSEEEIAAQVALGLKIKHFGQANNRRVCFVIEVDKDPAVQAFNIVDDTSGIHSTVSTQLQFITSEAPNLTDKIFSYPTIWETEPSQIDELNVYYEASQNIPTKIQGEDRELFAPIGCKVEIIALPNANNDAGVLDNSQNGVIAPGDIPQDMRLVSWGEGQSFTLDPGLPVINVQGNPANYHEALFRFTREDNSYTIGKVNMPDLNWTPATDDVVITDFIISEENDQTLEVGLSWYNIFSFGDGIESNRIRDGFNEMRIYNGARASATLEEAYVEENRKSGLIYSGIYNSDSGVNNLNQFIAAEKITKDLNPTYGSIQKLFSRNTDLVAFCEDRVLKILANKDALFNADGNPQLVSSNNVLGQAVPFVGDYGISQNPESFAYDSYRAYFTDKQRGAVLRLSMDGLTPISDAGMRDYFRDNLVEYAQLLGSYDGYSKHYNLTIKPKPGDTSSFAPTTVSFNEDVKGWVSFKSFIPESGLSLSNQYYTISEGRLYQHNTGTLRNNFYGIPYDSTVTAIINAQPSTVKIFNTINYEGSQAKTLPYVETVDGNGDTVNNLSTYNAFTGDPIEGWHVENVTTDLQAGTVSEFIKKEGKWFNYIKGLNNAVDVSELNFQGLGIALTVS